MKKKSLLLSLYLNSIQNILEKLGFCPNLPEEDLRAKNLDLEKEIKSKDREIYDYLDRIDQLENTIMKLESLLQENNGKDSKKRNSR